MGLVKITNGINMNDVVRADPPKILFRCELAGD